MVSLRFQKRLAASVLGCGKGKVWLDPNEVNEIAMANSSEHPRRRAGAPSDLLSPERLAGLTARNAVPARARLVAAGFRPGAARRRATGPRTKRSRERRTPAGPRGRDASSLVALSLSWPLCAFPSAAVRAQKLHPYLAGHLAPPGTAEPR